MLWRFPSTPCGAAHDEVSGAGEGADPQGQEGDVVVVVVRPRPAEQFVGEGLHRAVGEGRGVPAQPFQTLVDGMTGR